MRSSCSVLHHQYNIDKESDVHAIVTREKMYPSVCVAKSIFNDIIFCTDGNEDQTNMFMFQYNFPHSQFFFLMVLTASDLGDFQPQTEHLCKES